MSSELSTVGGVTLGLVIKRIKGRLYVYDYVRIDGKPTYKYVGPLEEIVRTYQALKAGLTVNCVLRTKDLRRLSQYIVVNLMEALKSENNDVWCRRGDLNPRHPGLQPGALPG